MTDSDDTDTDTQYVPENSDTTDTPADLSDGEDWQCKACGTPLEDAHALAAHECED